MEERIARLSALPQQRRVVLVQQDKYKSMQVWADKIFVSLDLYTSTTQTRIMLIVDSAKNIKSIDKPVQYSTVQRSCPKIEQLRLAYRSTRIMVDCGLSEQMAWTNGSNERRAVCWFPLKLKTAVEYWHIVCVYTHTSRSFVRSKLLLWIVPTAKHFLPNHNTFSMRERDARLSALSTRAMTAIGEWTACVCVRF
jgi:hypothetical protein